jgi:hypothetical protein
MDFRALQVQQTLARYYRHYMADPAELANTGVVMRDMRSRVETLEDAWLDQEMASIDADALPKRKEEFLAWYQGKERAINIDISEFITSLQERATLEQVAYYICMEEMIDGSFDDLMAMLQVGMPIRQKMIAGSNYWDELGNGNFDLVHATMFKTSSKYMREYLTARAIPIGNPTAQCLMNGNILLLMATRRDYNLRLIGAVGLVEGSAPKRFNATTKAMKRLKLPPEVIEYHRSHIAIDTKHSRDWFDNVLTEYASRGEQTIRELSLGVSIRYQVALGYYESMLSDMRNIVAAA